MKAALLKGLNQFEIETIEKPIPKEHEVLVKLKLQEYVDLISIKCRTNGNMSFPWLWGMNFLESLNP